MQSQPAVSAPILRVEALRVELEAAAGRAIVVDDLDLALYARQTTAVVGESGSGKSMTALAIMGLLPARIARVGGGRVLMNGRDLLTLPEAQMRRMRGAEIAMIFQEPMTSLNPVLSVGQQICEAIAVHRPGIPRAAMRAHALALMDQVRLPDSARAFTSYPHELSGGQRQRVMIAIALACDPKVLLADEPTTALDATVQADILDLLRSLQDERGLAILLITHNLGVVADFAERVVVMYAGRAVEEARAADLFRAPQHPYTRGLIGALPVPRLETRERTPLHEIPGIVPPLWALPRGCAFAPRCPLVMPICENRPPLEPIGTERRVACFAATGSIERGTP